MFFCTVCSFIRRSVFSPRRERLHECPHRVSGSFSSRILRGNNSFCSGRRGNHIQDVRCWNFFRPAVPKHMGRDYQNQRKFTLRNLRKVDNFMQINSASLFSINMTGIQDRYAYGSSLAWAVAWMAHPPAALPLGSVPSESKYPRGRR